MKGDCASCAKEKTCKKICGIMYGFCNTDYEERQTNGEPRLFLVTFEGREWGLYTATSREAVLKFFEVFGVAETDICGIREVKRVPLGCSVTETGV